MSFKTLPFSLEAQSRLMKQQSVATVQHLIDAVVELTTNCNDSYCRLENEGQYLYGKIHIYVNREKGGRCREFKIRDYAEGMNEEKLLKAIGYAEKSSGFIEGKTVRGMLGRGLKESIIGLGIDKIEGEIYTKKQGLKHGIKIYEQGKHIGYEYIDINNLDKNKIDPDIIEFLNSEESGTLIKIKVKNEKIKIPECEKFRLQIENHYALRDINSSENRQITLKFEELGGRKSNISSSLPIKFIYPKGELVFNDSIQIPNCSDSIKLKIWESAEPLYFKSYDNSSIAGILVKTKGAVLDNKLFKFENESAAVYFFGEAYCEGIADRLHKLAEEGREPEIIDLARKGLNWKSNYCYDIQRAIEKELLPLVEKKKKAIESNEKKETSPRTKEMLNNISKLLDRLARFEFKDWEGPTEPTSEIEIKSLTILPIKANVNVDESRTLSIYAPKELVEIYGVKTIISSDCSDIKIVFPGTKRLVMYLELNLKPHPKYPNKYYNFLKVRGRELDDQANIFCKLGNQEASALVVVKKQKKRGEKKGGFISKIEEENTINPIQRVMYEKGKIKIYVKFPGVTKYFPNGLKEIEEKEGSRVMLAEIIGETFCKTLAERKLETGEITPPEGGLIAAFNSEVNSFQKKYLDKIHEIILNYKFK